MAAATINMSSARGLPDCGRSDAAWEGGGVADPRTRRLQSAQQQRSNGVHLTIASLIDSSTVAGRGGRRDGGRGVRALRPPPPSIQPSCLSPAHTGHDKGEEEEEYDEAGRVPEAVQGLGGLALGMEGVRRRPAARFPRKGSPHLVALRRRLARVLQLVHAAGEEHEEDDELEDELNDEGRNDAGHSAGRKHAEKEVEVGVHAPLAPPEPVGGSDLRVAGSGGRGPPASGAECAPGRPR